MSTHRYLLLDRQWVHGPAPFEEALDLRFQPHIPSIPPRAWISRQTLEHFVLRTNNMLDVEIEPATLKYDGDLVLVVFGIQVYLWD